MAAVKGGPKGGVIKHGGHSNESGNAAPTAQKAARGHHDASAMFSAAKGHVPTRGAGKTTAKGRRRPIISAPDDAAGIVGFAPSAPIGNYRVTDGGFFTDAPVICALNQAVADGFVVVNMSLGGFDGNDDGDACSQLTLAAFHRAFCNATQLSGVTIVSAAGQGDIHNVGTDLAGTWPARWNQGIAVTSMNTYDPYQLGPPPGYNRSTNLNGQQYCDDPNNPNPIALPTDLDDTRTKWSNWVNVNSTDMNHTVAASGSCVWTMTKLGTYSFDSGTSFAAPEVTGMVILCKRSGSCPMRDYSVTIPGRFATDAYTTEYFNLRYGYWGEPFHVDPAFPVFKGGYLICACNY